MRNSFRCFVAVALPDHLREAIRDFFQPHATPVGGVKWIRREHLHLTLKFLGDVVAERIPTLAAALDDILAPFLPFQVRLRGAGAFPAATRPRVIWIGVAEGAAELTALAGAVERSMVALGFPPEERPFAAHLTVGRVKGPLRDPAALPALIEGVRERAWGEMLVPEVHLMRSELFPEGPRYSILHTTSLPGSPRSAERTGR